MLSSYRTMNPPWDDVKGDIYHYPNTYKNILQEGCRVIYYTGKAGKNPVRDRLSNEPHYFGDGVIGERISDPENPKNYYCEILDFRKFRKPILAKREDGTFLETIPQSRQTNYWRFGVRAISKEDFDSILGESIQSRAKLRLPIPHGELESFSASEGTKRYRYSSYYERNPILRQRALELHGHECMACGFSFEKTYGQIGREFAHVHHNKPVSVGGSKEVNPVSDLSVLCANCHAMVHRKKDNTLSIADLKRFLGRA